MSKPKILVIDDDVDFVKAIDVVLEDQGYRVVTAFNGNEGLKKAKLQKPDLILLDIMLPDIDGFSVCRKLKENPEAGHIPVLILSAISKKRKGEKYAAKIALYHNADGFIEKPIKKEELRERIENLLLDRRGVALGQSKNKRKILIVDDDLDFVSAVEKILKSNKFEVFVAENGIEALKIARAFLPDAVLLDIMLPGKDGYTVCYELKRNPKTHNIPIILVSAIGKELSKPEYAKQIASQHEANGYIGKPIRAEELLKELKKHIPL